MAFSGVKALDKVDFDIYPRRGALPRRQQLRQVDDDQGHLGGLPAQRGRDRDGRQVLLEAHPDRGYSERRPGHLPGLLRLPESHRHGEPGPYRRGVRGPQAGQLEEVPADRRGGLSPRSTTVDLDARVGDLSVADKQLVAICRALLTDTKLLNGRADDWLSPIAGRGAVQGRRRPAGAQDRDPLRQPQAGGGLRDQRAVHHHPQRQAGDHHRSRSWTARSSRST